MFGGKPGLPEGQTLFIMAHMGPKVKRLVVISTPSHPQGVPQAGFALVRLEPEILL